MGGWTAKLQRRCFVVLVWGSLLAVGIGVRADSEEAVATPKVASKKPTAQRSSKTPQVQQRIEKSLLGRWQLEDSEDVLEFRSDGVFVGKTHAVEMTTRWEVTPEGKLAIEFGLPIARKPVPATTTPEPRAAAPTVTTKIVREVRFEKEMLILRDPVSGQTYRYRRLR